MLFQPPQQRQDALAASVPLPSRLGKPEDHAKQVRQIIANDRLDGEVIWQGGVIRRAAK